MIVPELSYNAQANMAYSEVAVFKFADKVWHHHHKIILNLADFF